MFTRGWRRGLYAPAEQPRWPRARGAAPCAAGPTPTASPRATPPASVGCSMWRLGFWGPGGQRSFCLYTEWPSLPLPCAVQGDSVLSESFLHFKSCSPDSENRRGRPTFSWPQCFAPDGVQGFGQQGKSEKELGGTPQQQRPRNARQGGCLHPRCELRVRLSPSVGCKMGCRTALNSNLCDVEVRYLREQRRVQALSLNTQNHE